MQHEGSCSRETTTLWKELQQKGSCSKKIANRKVGSWWCIFCDQGLKGNYLLALHSSFDFVNEMHFQIFFFIFFIQFLLGNPFLVIVVRLLIPQSYNPFMIFTLLKKLQVLNCISYTKSICSVNINMQHCFFLKNLEFDY